MSTTVKFYRKNVYGNDLLYCADKEQNKAITVMTGKSTITHSIRAGLEKLGFTFVEVLESSIR